MKVIQLFFTAMVSLLAIYANAQNTFPANGDVGIGTTSPLNKLHVEGGGEPRSVQTLFPPTNITGAPVSGLRLSWYNDSWDIRAHRSGSYPIDAFSVARNGTEYFRIGAGGNVGIGTISPNEKLEINGNLKFSNYNSIINSGNIAYLGFGFGAFGYMDLKLHTGEGYRDNIIYARGDNGNVGIGTNNPLTALQIGNFNNGGAENQLSIPGTYNFEQLRLGQIGNGNQALEFVNHQSSYSSYGIRFLVDVDQASGLQIQYSPPQTSYNDLSYNTGLYLNLDGNIGIGTVTPVTKLDVNGDIRINDSNRFFGSYFQTNDYSTMTFMSRAWESVQGTNGKAFSFQTHNNAGNGGFEMMAIYYGENGKVVMVPNGGNVGIGTATPREKLSVNGKIRAQEIKVETANWPDYVFEDNFQPPSLAALETYIKINKHLPEIPSVREVEENGVSLGEMNAKLLKKIEELTLYVLELKNENEKQQEEINNLKNPKQ